MTGEQRSGQIWPAEVLALAGDGIICTDSAGRVFLFNQAAEQMFGYRVDDVLGRRIEILMPSRFRRIHRQHARAFVSDAEPVQRLMGKQREVLGRRSNGAEFPLEIMLSRQLIGNRLVLIAVTRDISERMRVEEELRRSEAWLREAQRVGGVGFWEFEPATKRMVWSPELFEIFGHDPVRGEPSLEELRGLYEPAQVPEFEAQLERAVHEGVPYQAERKIRRSDGSWRWVRVRAHPCLGPDGSIIRLLGTQVDITELKEREEALRVSEQRFRMALVNSPVVLFNQDSDLRYTWVHNPKLGFSAEEVLGKTDADLLEPEDAAQVGAIKRRVIATGRPERQEVRTSKAGVEGWYDLYVEPLRGGRRSDRRRRVRRGGHDGA